MTPDIRPLVAGNWKMNGDAASLREIEAMASRYDNALAALVDLTVCPPATLLCEAAKRSGKGMTIGAQDCHGEKSGAHTGDISAEMIAGCGAKSVIVGHSERRTDHHEDDDTVREKAEAAWRAGLVAIVCVGETRRQRDAGEAVAVVTGQLAGSIPDGATAANTIVAYEPVWAIGTGLTPTAGDVEAMHAAIREEVTRIAGREGQRMRLLYGGSVKPSNAAELLAVANVDGALVGGASLKADDFIAIAGAYHTIG